MPLKVSPLTAVRARHFGAKPRIEAKTLVIGVEFNQSQITSALIDEQARVLARRRVETPQRTTRAVVAALTQSLLELANTNERDGGLISAIGLGVAGLVDPATERVSIDGMKGWTRVPLGQLIEEGLNETGYDIRTPSSSNRARADLAVSAHPAITIGSHLAAVAAAEGWVGAAPGKSNVVYLSVGTTIETGILAGGRALAGAGGLAGAAAWLAVGEHFKAEYETEGCLSAEASIKAITRRAIEEWDGKSGSMLSGLIKSNPSQLDAATVIRAARGGDKLAVKVINDTCRWLGRGVANLISVLNPEAVVIGGNLGLALKKFIDEIRDEARRWAAPGAAKQCRIVSATAGENAGVIGSARLAWLKAGK